MITMSSALSPTRLVAIIIPSQKNQTMVEMMGKWWTLTSHSWSNTTTRLWAGLIGFTGTSAGTALPFVQRNVRGPSLHLLLGLLHSTSLATGPRRKLAARPKSSCHLPHDWKRVPRPWSSSTIPRTSNRFCCISTHGSWTNPLWQAGPPRSARAHPVKMCLSQHKTKAQILQV